MSIDATSLTPFLHAASQDAPSETQDTAEAARQMEEQFLRVMLKELKRSIPSGGLLQGSVAIYDSVFDEHLAQTMAEAGGIGIGERLAAYLNRPTGDANAPEANASEPSALREGHTFEAGARPTHSLTPQRFQDATPPRFDATTLPFPSEATQHPVSEGIITSHFGLRNDPFSGELRSHRGIDIAAPEGAAFHPIAEGTVMEASKRGGYGNLVVVDHGDGWTSSYAHCETLTVHPGDHVGLESQLGTVGQTGRATGPHLHLELRHDGQAINPHEALGWPEEHVEDHALAPPKS